VCTWNYKKLSNMAEAQAQTMQADQLTIPQLQQQKEILEQDLSYLTDTVARLKAAQQAYDLSAKSLAGYGPDSEDKEILIPLANSVYIPGRAKNVHRVLLNIGTGYYVDLQTAVAKNHCVEKAGMLANNISRFAKTLAEKRSHLETCMQLLAYKLQK
jgi:prefoldin alpha subunit